MGIKDQGEKEKREKETQTKMVCSEAAQNKYLFSGR